MRFRSAHIAITTSPMFRGLIFKHTALEFSKVLPIYSSCTANLQFLKNNL